MLVRGTPPILGAGPSMRIGMRTTVVSTAVILMSPPCNANRFGGSVARGAILPRKEPAAILAADGTRLDSPETFVHRSLLPLLGMPIGELWDLDALAADSAQDGTWDSLLTSAPLNLRGGVASPPHTWFVMSLSAISTLT